jgi:hypothetical protein
MMGTREHAKIPTSPVCTAHPEVTSKTHCKYDGPNNYSIFALVSNQKAFFHGAILRANLPTLSHPIPYPHTNTIKTPCPQNPSTLPQSRRLPSACIHTNPFNSLPRYARQKRFRSRALGKTSFVHSLRQEHQYEKKIPI